MSAIDRMKQAKHGLHVARRAGAATLERVRDDVRSRAVERRTGPFDADRHREGDGQFAMDYFLSRLPQAGAAAATASSASVVPRRIFVAWTDGNPLTPNRADALESIRRANPDVPVEFVTTHNLHEWVLAEHPLHPAYEQLSAIHRSDYLRAYLLHHHGGGWSDIKRTTHNWAPFFDAMEADEQAWVLGYPEARSRDVVFHDSRMGRELAARHRAVAANCAFILRPGTPFSAAWLEEVEARLDYFARALRRHPAVDPFGREGGYPLPWSVLQGHVFQPLQLVYSDHIRLDERMRPQTTDHR